MKNKVLNRKQLTWLGIAWFIGISLLILAMTDVFREPFFEGANTLPIILIVLSAATLISKIINYKNSKSDQDL